MSYTFDGLNKLVILSPGTVTVDLVDLWSRYKDWLISGSSGFLPAYDTVGGEPVDSVQGTRVPLFLFQKNGWKIRPQEATHTLSVSGGTLIVDGGGDPFTNTLGNYNVRVKYSQPIVAIGYNIAGNSGNVDAALIANLVREALLGDMATINSNILSRHPENQLIPSDVKRVNGVVIKGVGTESDPWNPI